MKKFLMPLLVLVIAAVISVVLYFVRIEIHKDWQTTIGTVTKVEVTRKSSHRIGGGGKTFHYYWTYNIDGVEYSGYETFGGNKMLYNIGDKKEIWYNPDNHSESRFVKPGPELYPYIPFIFAITVMLAVYSLQAKKENKSLHW